MKERAARDIIRKLTDKPCWECGEWPGMTGAVVFLLMNGAISEADLARALGAKLPAWGKDGV